MIHLAVLSVRSGSAESFRLVSCLFAGSAQWNSVFRSLFVNLQAAGASLRAATVDAGASQLVSYSR